MHSVWLNNGWAMNGFNQLYNNNISNDSKQYEIVVEGKAWVGF